MKIGAKTNLDDISVVKALADESDFIEVYYTEGIDYKKLPKTVYTMHCPHGNSGVNLSFPEKKSGIEIVKRSLELAEQLRCKYAVIHPGENDPGANLKNMIVNLKKVNEFAKARGIRLLLETVPYFSRETKDIPHTISLPDEYVSVINEVGCGFCLDISHVSGTAAYHKKDYKALTLEFVEKLKPTYFHIYNTCIKTPWDEHYAIEDPRGTMDMEFAFSITKKNDLVVFELPDPKVKNFINAKKYLQKRGLYP